MNEPNNGAQNWEPAKKPLLCPFKKMTERETNQNTGKTITHELFEPCAGARCMAYMEGMPGEPPCCLRFD